MTRRKTPIGMAMLTIIALAGCASFHAQPESARAAYLPAQIRVVEKDNVSLFCIDDRATLGCVVRVRETNQCIVFVKSGLPYEVHGNVIINETKRCMESV